MTYGSNESLYYPDEEFDLNLRTGTPLQKSFEKVDVLRFEAQMQTSTSYKKNQCNEREKCTYVCVSKYFRPPIPLFRGD